MTKGKIVDEIVIDANMDLMSLSQLDQQVFSNTYCSSDQTLGQYTVYVILQNFVTVSYTSDYGLCITQTVHTAVGHHHSINDHKMGH